MTTSSTLPADLDHTIPTNPDTPPCPAWCELTPHHDWDSTGDGRLSRGHSKRFGTHVEVFAQEFNDTPGQVVAMVVSPIVDNGHVFEVEDAMGYARELIDAAEFLADLAQRNAFELGRDYERSLTRQVDA